MSGIQALQELVGPVRPPTLPPVLLGPAQVASCPSLHRLGVMKPKRGVVVSLRRSWARWPLGDGVPFEPSVPSGTTLASHSAVLSMTEWNQTKGLCRVVYWSCGGGNLGRVGRSDRRVGAVGPADGSGVPPSRAGCCPCPARTPARTPTCVALFGGYLRVELGGDRRHRSRVHAALAVHLPRVDAPGRRPGVPGVTSAKAKPLSAQSAWVSSVGACPETSAM